MTIVAGGKGMSDAETLDAGKDMRVPQVLSNFYTGDSQRADDAVAFEIYGPGSARYSRRKTCSRTYIRASWHTPGSSASATSFLRTRCPSYRLKRRVGSRVAFLLKIPRERQSGMSLAGRLSSWSLEPGDIYGADLGGALEVTRLKHYLRMLAGRNKAA